LKGIALWGGRLLRVWLFYANLVDPSTIVGPFHIP
jgi:hypothetical protein